MSSTNQARTEMKSHKIFYAMWTVNLSVFVVTLWGGEYLIEELEMQWISGPRACTLVSCGIAKLVLSIVCLYTLLKERELTE